MLVVRLQGRCALLPLVGVAAIAGSAVAEASILEGLAASQDRPAYASNAFTIPEESFAEFIRAALADAATIENLSARKGPQEEEVASSSRAVRAENFQIAQAPARDSAAGNSESVNPRVPRAVPGAERWAMDEPSSVDADRTAGIGVAESEAPFSITGFYDFGLGFTYADPSHWSQAVNRLAVDAGGFLNDRVKYKVGVRVDIDPVYYGSNFYLADVKQNQRLDVFWRENYIDFPVGDWDIRIGAQNIVWGEVVGLFVADVVSARDMREFLLPSFDIIRIPQWAARAEYFAGDSHVELVWIPVQTLDKIGKPGADFYPAPLPSPTTPEAASAIAGIAKPSTSLKNSAFGLRANTLLAGWDLAAFYYRSYSSEPTFFRVAAPAPGSALFQPRYDRIWQAGTTVTKDFNSFVIRAEAVYAYGQNFASTDPTAPQGVVQRPTLDYIVSVDFPFANDAHANFQAFQRVYFGGSDSIALKTGSYGLSATLSGKLTNTLEPQIQWIQTIGGGGGLIRPRLNWLMERNTSIGIGVDIFTGSIEGFFGRYNNRDRVYTELRYAF